LPPLCTSETLAQIFQVLTGKVKQCKYCNKLYPEEFFEVANVIKGKAYRRNKCKTCKQETQNIRSRGNRKEVNAFKETLVCLRCGISDPRVLEFHHPDPTQKEYNIGNMFSYSLEKIHSEIAKCNVLCANCHKITHWELKQI
jgi:hypothetical protein